MYQTKSILSVKVSIIVPNYNHKAFLPERLDSIFNQSFQDFEVILLDDASTDGSRELLQCYEGHPKVSHVLYNKVNSGSPFKQWQKGVEKAKGEYVWIAESDDVASIYFLSSMVEILLEDLSVGIAYCDSLLIDEDSMIIDTSFKFKKQFANRLWEKDFMMNGSKYVKEYLGIISVIPNASAVVFKKSLLSVGVFDEELLAMRICGDWLFWNRLCYLTNIAYSRKAMNMFRFHNAVTRNHDSRAKRLQRIKEEWIGRKLLRKEIKLKNKVAESILLEKWTKFFPVKGLFSKEFYSLSQSVFDSIRLLSTFIMYKISNNVKSIKANNQ